MSTKTEANPLRVFNVSMRDRAIYQAVMVDGKSQRAMAVEHMVRRNAEVGEGRSEKEEGRSEEGEDIAERQLASHSLSSVLRGEGRGEGLELREDEGRSENAEGRSEEVVQIKEEYPPYTQVITSATPQQSGNNDVITPTETLSKKSPGAAQVPQKPAVTNSQLEKTSLSNSPPKGPRFRLMGTAAEMAESLGYDEFFSPEQRLARAFEKARVAREGREQEESLERGRPLTPTLVCSYKGSFRCL